MCPNHCKLVEHLTFLLFIFGCMYLDSIPNLDYLCFNSFFLVISTIILCLKVVRNNVQVNLYY